MASIEVGRVTIKVSPDTKDFRGDTEKQITRAVKGIDESVPVDAEFDDKGLRQQTAVAAKKAQQTVKFKVNEDFERSIVDMEKNLAAIEKKRQSALLANIAAAKKQREAAARHEETRRLGASERLNSAFREAAEKRISDEIAYQNDLAEERQRIQRLTASEAAQDAATRKRIGDQIGKAEKKRSTEILALRKKNQKNFDFPNFGTGLNPQAYLVIFSALLAYAGPLIGLMTTALLALPGLIGLVAAPIAALALGMDGVKFAAKQLEAPLKEMKKVLSAQAADTFTPIFARLPAAMLAVTPALAGVTRGIGDFTTGIVNAVAEEDGLLRLQGTLNNIGGFFKGTAPFAERFTAGLNTLANEFSAHLPDLGEWFNEQGREFDEWVGKVSSNGQLDQAFKNLGSVLDGVWIQIKRILSAAFDGFSDENGADLLNASFSTLGDTLVKIINFSNILIEKMEQVNRVASGISALFKIVAGDPFGAAEDIVYAARGGERPDYDGSDADPVIEPTVSPEAIATAKSDLENLYVFGQEGADATGEAFGKALSVGGRAGGAGAVDFELPVIKGLESGETEEQLQERLQAIQTITSQVEGALSQAVTGETLPTPNFEAFESAWTGMGTVVDTAAQQVAEAPTKFATSANAITSSFSGMGAATITAFGEMVGAVRTGTNDAVTIMEGLPPRMTAPIEAIAAAVYKQGLAIGEGLAKGIRESTDEAVTAATELSQKVQQASKTDLKINSPSLAYEEQGKSIIEGLALGINGQAYLAQLAIKNAASPSSDSKKAIKQAYEDLGREGVVAGDTLKELQNLPFTPADGARLSELTKLTKDLNSQLRFLKADLAASDSAGDVAIQAEIDRIKLIKERHDLEKKGLKLHKEAAGVKGDAQKDELDGADYLNKAIGAGTSFALANANQFASDLGIGGSGAISQGIDQGISFLTSSLSKLVSGGFGGSGGNIIVNNVDDAVHASNNQINKQKKQFVGR